MPMIVLITNSYRRSPFSVPCCNSLASCRRYAVVYGAKVRQESSSDVLSRLNLRTRTSNLLQFKYQPYLSFTTVLILALSTLGIIIHVPAVETTCTALKNSKAIMLKKTIDYRDRTYHWNPYTNLSALAACRITCTKSLNPGPSEFQTTEDIKTSNSVSGRDHLLSSQQQDERQSAQPHICYLITTRQQPSSPIHFSGHQMRLECSQDRVRRPAALALPQTLLLPARQVGSVRTRPC